MKYVIAFVALYGVFLWMWKRFWDFVGDPPAPASPPSAEEHSQRGTGFRQSCANEVTRRYTIGTKDSVAHD